MSDKIVPVDDLPETTNVVPADDLPSDDLKKKPSSNGQSTPSATTSSKQATTSSPVIDKVKGMVAQRQAQSVPEQVMSQPKYTIDGKPVKSEELKENLFKNDFVQKFQQGLIDVTIEDDPEMEALAARQYKSGTRIGDKWEWFKSDINRMLSGVFGFEHYAGQVLRELTGNQDVPLEASEKFSKEAAKLFQGRSAELAEQTRQYEDGFIKSVGEGNIVDAVDQGFNAVAGSTATAALIAATSAVGGMPASLGAMSGITASSEYSGSDQYEGLTNAQKLTRSTIVGGAEALGEYVTAGILKKNFGLVRDGMRNLIWKASQTAGKDAAEEVAKELAKKTAIEMAKDYGIDIMKEGASEGVTQLVQMLTDDYMGVQDYELKDYVEQISEATVLGGFMGATLGAPTAATATKRFIDEQIKKGGDGGGGGGFVERQKDIIKTKVEQGQMTPEQAGTVNANIDSRAEAVSAVPAEMVGNTKLVDIIEEKKKIEKEMEAADPMLKDVLKEKIDSKNEELAAAIAAMKKPPQEPPGGTGGAAMIEEKPEKIYGFHTPVVKGGESVSKLQSAMLPVGKFIALDAPFSSDVHNPKDAVNVSVDLSGKKVYNPDGIRGFEKTPSLQKEMSDFLNNPNNRKEGKSFEELMTEFYSKKGYDAYVREIDGGMRNHERELIVFDRSLVKEEKPDRLKDVESTAKDDKGVPINEGKWYHGTPIEGINELKPNDKGLIFFTRDKNIADRYATNDFEGNTPSNNVFEKKLLVKNIFDPEKHSENNDIIELLANTGDFTEYKERDFDKAAQQALEDGDWRALETKGFIDGLKKLGYDAIFIDNRPHYAENYKGERTSSRDIAVFDTKAVESVLSKEPKKSIADQENKPETDLDVLEKEYNSKSVDELVALKKKLYPNPDIESPMSPEEKLLTKVIAAKFSDINAEILRKRKLTKVSTEAEAALTDNPALSLEGFAKKMDMDKEDVREAWQAAFDKKMKDDTWVKKYNVTQAKEALNNYEEKDHTVADVADQIESANIPELQKALDKFREEQEYDRELSGRGDMDDANDKFMAAVEKYVAKSEPKKKEKKPSKIIDLTLKQKRKNNFRRAVKKYANYQAKTPREAVLQFFATGGRLNQDEVKDRTGYKAEDLFGWVSKNGVSYDRLMESISDDLGMEFDQIDLKNEIDAIISKPKKDVFDELKKVIAAEQGEFPDYDDAAALFEGTSDMTEEEQDAILEYSDVWLDDQLTPEQQEELNDIIAQEAMEDPRYSEKISNLTAQADEKAKVEQARIESEKGNPTPQDGDKVQTSDQRKAELEDQLKRANSRLDKAEKALAKAKESISGKKDLFRKEEQGSMIPLDKEAAQQEMNRLNKERDVAAGEVERLNELLTGYAKGQVKMDIPESPAEPSKQQQRKIRDEKLRDEIDDLWDEFGKDIKPSMGIDPNQLATGIKIISKYTQAGIYKLSDILEDASVKLGERFAEMFDAIKAAYSAYSTQAPDEIADKMDDSKTVRAVKIEQFQKQEIKPSQDESKKPTTGGGQTRPQSASNRPQPADTPAVGGAGVSQRPPIRVVDEGDIPQPGDHVRVGQYDIDEHQRLGVNLAIQAFSDGKKGFLLGDGTGVGKTREILVTAAEWKKKSKKPVLIVTQNKQIIEGSFAADSKALGISLRDFDIHTYTDISNGKVPKKDYGLVIYDEAHNLKNADSQKAIGAQEIKTDNKMFATATPMDRPISAAYFLSEITGKPMAEIQKMLGFTTAMVEDPVTKKMVMKVYPQQGQTWTQVFKHIIDLRDEAIRNGQMIRREYPFYGEITSDKISLGEDFMTEQMTISDFWDEKMERAFGNAKKNIAGQRIGELSRHTESRKADAVYQIVKDAISKGKSVIVVGEGVNNTVIKGLNQMRAEEVPGLLSNLAARLEQEGIKVARIYGTGDKSNEIARFNKGEVQVALATPQSGGTGVNLDDTVGDRPRLMLLATTNYSGDQMDQMFGRVSRRNTKSPAEVRLLIASESMSDARRLNIFEQKATTLRRVQAGEDPDMVELEQSGADAEQEQKQSQQNAPYIQVKDGQVMVFNSYSIKDRLKALGARWHKFRKAWVLPHSMLETAQKIVDENNDIAARIRNKKIDGAMSAIDFGISQTIYNGALEFMARQVERGTKIGNAIANTIKWVDEKMEGKKWNKGAFGKYMNDTYTVKVNGKDVEVRRDDSKQTAALINGFYSPLEQGIMDAKVEKTTGKDWLKRLQGVTEKDELKFTGVEDFLNENKDKSLTKKEVLDFMKENRIEIVEVVKNSEKRKLTPKEQRQRQQLLRKDELTDEEEELFERLQSIHEGEALGETKFSKWQLEGKKENYKEVLVTMPKILEVSDKEKRFIEIGKKVNPTNEEIQEWKKLSDEVTVGGKKIIFKSTHFDEPNILVHLRMNTRTDSEGRKVLFVEEVQSDFSQGYRKQAKSIESYVDNNSAKVIEAFKKKGILKVKCP